MIPLITGNVLFYNSLHPYVYTDDYIYDIIVVGEENGKLVYVVVDKTTYAITERHIIPYKSKSARLFKPYCPYLYQTDLQLSSAVGFYRIVGTHIITTLYIVQYHPIRKTYYLAQCNMKDHDITSIELVPIISCLDTKKQLIDVMLRKASVYTDTKSVSDYDVYMMYKGLDPNNRECVSGIRILVTEEAQEEFATTMNLSFLPSEFPIFDQYTSAHYRFYDIPPRTTEMSFNFSTGMGIVRFEED